MQIISFFESDRQEHWLKEIGKSDWEPGIFLYELLSEETFYKTVGEGSRVLLLTEHDKLISYCTYAEKDDIQPTDLTPWIGFVYTFPQYRGNRFAGFLLREIERIAREEQVPEIFISTNHVGLYEKYGYEYRVRMKDLYGQMSRVYAKRI